MRDFSHTELENAVIYEVNIRQYSKEGTFKSFEKDLPLLKELGVRILWFMPIQPISLTKRKAENLSLIESIEDESQRKRTLGSPYAIADYTTIHPDYGSMQDFKQLVSKAHALGIFVILDWVANHTGWDHKWLSERPEFYHKNQKGEITEPTDRNGKSLGWNDVAHLNYAHKELRQAMYKQMEFWLKETDIDGFRCDVADMVPLDFWEFAVSKLRETKAVFMLAESDHREFLQMAFSVGYDWKIHYLMNEIAAGRKNVVHLDEAIRWEQENYSSQTVFMRFTSNHDENAWKGSASERLGEAEEAFAALTYLLPGLPLIYNGQEYDAQHRLKFFEKDEILKNKGKMFKVYTALGKLKNNHPALNGGFRKATYRRINTSDDKNILAFVRENKGRQLIYLANLSAQTRNFTLPLTGAFENYMPGRIHLWNGIELSFSPWQYWILSPVDENHAGEDEAGRFSNQSLEK